MDERDGYPEPDPCLYGRLVWSTREIPTADGRTIRAGRPGVVTAHLLDPPVFAVFFRREGGEDRDPWVTMGLEAAGWFTEERPG